MGQRRRHDGPGVWHHVANRGIARRSVFEAPADVRYFLSRLARAYRRGLLEIHAYSMMITHFHLLVRSPVGRLSDAMRLIQNPFVRWFNRRRRRDGPLFRGRFLSRPIKSDTDWWTVFRYVHLNSVKAGIVEHPEEYLHASAVHLVRAGVRPRWLLRHHGASESGEMHHRPEDTSAMVRQSLEPPLTTAEQEVVERRLMAPHAEEDPLDMLVGGAPSVVLAWLKRKSELADNTSPGLPVATPRVLIEILESAECEGPAMTLKPGRKSFSAWPVLRVGLLRAACGSSFSEISMHMGTSLSTAHQRSKEHLRQMQSCDEYSAVAAKVLSEALARVHEPVARIRAGFPTAR